jgi:exopolyphosphatase/guanosine-5'-triphosphate,3'-diphosphate pyrophosphatase
MGIDSLHSIIEIGSDSIRLTLAEIQGPGKWKIIDRSERPLSLGRDVFLTGKISRNSLYEALQILITFKESLAAYQIPLENIHVMATTAVRESSNREIFVERVHNKTDLNIHVIEGVEATHLTFLGVENSLAKKWKNISRSITMILEVGGGSTELMILKNGRIVSAHTLNIGSVRFLQQIGAEGKNENEFNRLLDEYLQTTLRQIQGEFDLTKVKNFISVGSFLELTMPQGATISEMGLFKTTPKKLDVFIDHLQQLDLEDIIKEYNLPIHEAEALLPSLMITRKFSKCCNNDFIESANTTLKNGVLQNLSTNGEILGFSPTLAEQISASSNSLGKKYNYDEVHANHVTQLALRIFDDLTEEHGLGKKERVYLVVAGILHDIGKFIGQSSHHKHGEYIIANSQIFGLDRKEHRIVGNIVRYHRRSMPTARHVPYAIFDTRSKIIVNKLAAILRLADCLDRNHNQKVKDLSVTKEADVLTFVAMCDSDIRSEITALKKKKEMFEEVYGLKVKVLAQDNSQLKNFRN